MVWGFAMYRTRALFKVKEFRPVDMQNRLHVLIHLGMASLFVRAIDPFGWRMLVPLPIILFAYDIGGASLVSIGVDIVFDWLSVVSFTKGGGPDKRKIILMKKIAKIIQCATFTSNITFSLLTSFVGPLWVWHLGKVAYQLTISIGMVIFLLYTGISLYCFLRKFTNEDNTTSDAVGASPALGTVSPITSSSSSSASSSATTAGDDRHTLLLQSETVPVIRRSQAVRLLKILVFCVLALFVTIFVWGQIVYDEIKNRYTYDDPPAPPTNLLHVFRQSNFDLIQLIGFLWTAIFFSKYKPPQIDPLSDAGNLNNTAGGAGGAGGRSLSSPPPGLMSPYSFLPPADRGALLHARAAYAPAPFQTSSPMPPMFTPGIAAIPLTDTLAGVPPPFMLHGHGHGAGAGMGMGVGMGMAGANGGISMKTGGVAPSMSGIGAGRSSALTDGRSHHAPHPSVSSSSSSLATASSSASLSHPNASRLSASPTVGSVSHNSRGSDDLSTTPLGPEETALANSNRRSTAVSVAYQEGGSNGGSNARDSAADLGSSSGSGIGGEGGADMRSGGTLLTLGGGDSVIEAGHMMMTGGTSTMSHTGGPVMMMGPAVGGGPGGMSATSTQFSYGYLNPYSYQPWFSNQQGSIMSANINLTPSAAVNGVAGGGIGPLNAATATTPTALSSAPVRPDVSHDAGRMTQNEQLRLQQQMLRQRQQLLLQQQLLQQQQQQQKQFAAPLPPLPPTSSSSSAAAASRAASVTLSPRRSPSPSMSPSTSSPSPPTPTSTLTARPVPVSGSVTSGAGTASGGGAGPGGARPDYGAYSLSSVGNSNMFADFSHRPAHSFVMDHTSFRENVPGTYAVSEAAVAATATGGGGVGGATVASPMMMGYSTLSPNAQLQLAQQQQMRIQQYALQQQQQQQLRLQQQQLQQQQRAGPQEPQHASQAQDTGSSSATDASSSSGGGGG